MSETKPMTLTERLAAAKAAREAGQPTPVPARACSCGCGLTVTKAA